MMRRTLNILVSGTLFFGPPCFGASKELSSGIDQFLKSCGASRNVTSSSSYRSQKANYASAGGVTIRSQTHNDRIATVDLPGMSAGCGGIDLWMGGAGFISGDEIKNFAKSAVMASGGYLFLLAMDTISPQISAPLKYIQNLAHEVNSQQINSCEIGSLLASAAWPRDTAAKERICRLSSSNSGLVSGIVQSRHKCQDADGFSEVRRRAEKSGDPYALALQEEYNLAWEVLEQKGLTANRDEAELIMSLVGTVVVRKDPKSGAFEATPFPPKAEDREFISKMLRGGECEVYRCLGDKGGISPLQVRSVKDSISQEKSWAGLIEKRLIDIQKRALADQELDADQIRFLEETRIPVYKLVNLISASGGNGSSVSLYEISDLIALDLLQQFVQDAIWKVRAGCSNLEGVGLGSEKLKVFLSQLASAESSLREIFAKERASQGDATRIHQVIDIWETRLHAEEGLFQ